MYKTWEINEIALMIYAKYKGLDYRQIAKMLDRKYGSINGKMYQINNFDTLGKKVRSEIDKAMILEGKVRAGFAPDHRKRWDDRISAITNIKYTYTESVEEKTEEVKELPPVFKLEINTNAIIEIIKAWKS